MASSNKKYPNLKYNLHYYRQNTQYATIAIIGESNYIILPVKIFNLKERKSTRELIDLIGRKHAMRLIRNNFRRSRLMITDDEQIKELIKNKLE